jgi:hypothetical protein
VTPTTDVNTRAIRVFEPNDFRRFAITTLGPYFPGVELVKAAFP